MNNRFSHLANKLTTINESQNPSTEEMQQQIKDLSTMLSEVMCFLNKDLAATLQQELKKKGSMRA